MTILEYDGVKEIGLGAALMMALLIVKETVAGLLRRRNGNGHTTVSSGDLPKEYWEKRFDQHDTKLENVHNDLRDIKASVMILIRWKGGD